MRKRRMTEEEADKYARGIASRVRWHETQHKMENYVDVKVALQERAEKAKGAEGER